MKNIVIKGWMVAVAVIVVMFGGIYLTIGTGHWATTREKEPAKLESGEYSPADIRGSYAYSELEQFFDVPTNVLFEAFLIPEGLREPTFLIKEMEDLFEPVVIDGTEIEVGTDLLRVFTSLYSGIPYESDETTHLPSSAVKMLIQEQKLDADQQAYWQAHTFELVPVDGKPEGEVVAEEQEAEEQEVVAEEHDEEEVSIKGGTTIGELIDYGLTEEQFKEITGMEIPSDRALGLRDFVTQNELDMETVKTALEELLVPAAEETSPTEEQSPTAESTEPQPVESSIEIKGSTTIGTLLDYGLTAEQFKEITGLDVPEDTAIKLKDFADANGLDMETIRTKITDALAQ
jgi:hypothetical protein